MLDSDGLCGCVLSLASRPPCILTSTSNATDCTVLGPTIINRILVCVYVLSMYVAGIVEINHNVGTTPQPDVKQVHLTIDVFPLFVGIHTS